MPIMYMNVSLPMSQRRCYYITSMRCSTCTQHVSQGLEGTHSLEDKVGACVASAIKKELSGTEFEWMLNIEREAPPPHNTYSSSQL